MFRNALSDVLKMCSKVHKFIILIVLILRDFSCHDAYLVSLLIFDLVFAGIESKREITIQAHRTYFKLSEGNNAILDRLRRKVG